MSTLTDSAGSATISYIYDAWGTLRDSVGTSTNRFTFNSLEFDSETNLFYAGARFYDPEVGRFLSQDPLLGDVTNVPSLHRYSYAFSNPLRFVDPFGLEAGDWYDPRSYDWGVFAKEFGKGLAGVGANIVTLGGAGSLQEALAEGRLDANSSSFDVAGIFAEGVLDTLTFGGFKGAVDSATSGEGSAVGGFVEGVGRTILPIDEVSMIASSDANGFEKAQAVATGLVKVASFGLIAGQAKAALSAAPKLGTAGGVNLLKPKVSIPPRPRTRVAPGRESFQTISKRNTAATVAESPTSSAAGARTVARTQRQTALRTRVEGNLARSRTGNRASNFQRHATRERVLSAIDKSAAARGASRFRQGIQGQRVRSVGERAFQFEAQQLVKQGGLGRAAIGKIAEVRATRTLRRFAEKNDIPLGPGGLRFQARGAGSRPDVVFDPARRIFDFKLTPKAIKLRQLENFRSDFPGFDISLIFGE